MGIFRKENAFSQYNRVQFILEFHGTLLIRLLHVVHKLHILLLHGRCMSESVWPFENRVVHSLSHMMSQICRQPLSTYNRGLRYYRIGIESPILLEKSIVLVSYQYQNSWTGKYRYQYQYRLFKVESISIGISITFFINEYQI